MTLDAQKAQNPLCHAGALALCSSLYEGQDMVDRSYELSEKLSTFAASQLRYCMASFLASKKYNSDCKALAYWMQSSVPLVGAIDETLDLFFQVQASYTSCVQLARWQQRWRIVDFVLARGCRVFLHQWSWRSLR